MIGDEIVLDFDNILGKVLLAEVCYFKNNEMYDRVQMYGKIIFGERNNKITICRNDNSLFSFPPDLSSVTLAQPGTYTLNSNGEKVDNPDLLAKWSVYYE